MKPTPTPRAQFIAPAYKVPRAPHPIDLRLDGNEGIGPSTEVLRALSGCNASTIRRYPSCAELEAEIAEFYGVAPDQVLITAGGDDAIQRLCRVFLGPGKELLLPAPTFEMIERFASWEQAVIRRIPWERPRYPTAEVVAAIDDATSLIAMVSPNNPTGGWATAHDLEVVAAAAPGALIMVDAAYAEFGSEDLTETALRLSNTVVLRTFSKALGLAGLRIGYALGKAEWIQAMRTAGLPYPVSQPSILVAQASLQSERSRIPYIAKVAEEREALAETLREADGALPTPRATSCLPRDPTPFGSATLWLLLESASVHGPRLQSSPGTSESPVQAKRRTSRDCDRPCRRSSSPRPCSSTWMGCSPTCRVPTGKPSLKPPANSAATQPLKTSSASSKRATPTTTGW